MEKKNLFLQKFKEDGDFNQYWYSQKTIEMMVSQVENSGCKRACFLSTPSVYFTLQKNSELRKNSSCFDFDKKLNKDPNFVFYDFNTPEEIPQEFHHQFDYILIDPPFITREVWEKVPFLSKYTATVNLVAKKEDGKITAKILCSSIDENQEMLQELVGVKIRKFRPLIPNLVYQYSLFSNYDDESLDQENPEVVF